MENREVHEDISRSTAVIHFSVNFRVKNWFLEAHDVVERERCTMSERSISISSTHLPYYIKLHFGRHYAKALLQRNLGLGLNLTGWQ